MHVGAFCAAIPFPVGVMILFPSISLSSGNIRSTQNRKIKIKRAKLRYFPLIHLLKNAGVPFINDMEDIK